MTQLAILTPASAAQAVLPGVLVVEGVERRRRRVRAPFRPPTVPGPYRLPDEVAAIAAGILAGRRNREAAWTLLVGLARFHAAPGRLGFPFPVDRREGAARPWAGGLSEARIRGALAALEEDGLLVRAPIPPGSRYQPTGEGLHRRPILFTFAPFLHELFEAASARARRFKARRGERRPISPAPARSPVTPPPTPESLRSPKKRGLENPSLLMGEVTTPFAGKGRGIALTRDRTLAEPASPAAPDPRLEASLSRLEALCKRRGAPGGSRASSGPESGSEEETGNGVGAGRDS